MERRNKKSRALSRNFEPFPVPQKASALERKCLVAPASSSVRPLLPISSLSPVLSVTRFAVFRWKGRVSRDAKCVPRSWVAANVVQLGLTLQGPAVESHRNRSRLSLRQSHSNCNCGGYGDELNVHGMYRRMKVTGDNVETVARCPLPSDRRQYLFVHVCVTTNCIARSRAPHSRVSCS
jgi:hypothetical protein